MSDATDEPALVVKKQPNVVLWLCCVLVVILLLFLWAIVGPDPAIVVSKQTTRITEPLRANGMPDYLEWLRRKQRQGVTPENNAAVLVWQAVAIRYQQLTSPATALQGPNTQGKPVPKDWKPFEFNGQTYYIVPLNYPDRGTPPTRE